MAEEFKVRIGAELDDASFDSIKDKISNAKLNPIKVKLDDKDVTTKLNNISQQINNLQNNNPIQLRMNDRTVLNQLANIRQQIQALGNITINLGGGNRGIGNTTTALQRAYREVYSLYNQIESMEMKIGKLRMSGIDAGNIAQYQQQLNTLRTTYQQLLSTLGSNNVNLDIVFTDIDRSRTAISQLSSAVDNVRTKLASDIKINIANGDIEGQIGAIEQKFNSLNIANNNVTTGITTLRALLNTMDASSDIESITSDYMVFKQVLETVTNQVNELQRQQKEQRRQQRETNDITKLDRDRNALSSKMDVWLHDNSAAAKQFGSQIESLKAQLIGCDRVQLDGIKSEFEQIKRDAKLAGKATLSFGDSFKAQLSKLGTYFSASMLITEGIRAVKEMYNNVVEIDTAMTDLLKVTDETDAAYQRFLNNAGKNAQDLGRSVSSYIQQSANWAKMGFDTVESSELAKISSIYANVADVDDATAVSDIVTAMKAFNIEAENAVSIIDPMNKISNEFAVTAAGLGQGLSRAASTMATAGTDLEHTLALLTGISEITQSPEEAGNFLKTAIARIQGMKGELEELGEEVDPTVDSISKVQTQILNLTDGKVNIFDENGEFRDYYYIMQDIADVVDELTSTDRATLYEILFGKNRMNQGAAMIQAFQSGQIGKALDAAFDSAGSAASEQEKWMDSLEAKLGSLEAAWQSLSSTFLDSDFLKTLIDSFTGFVNFLDWAIDKLGTINTIIAGISIGKAFKGISSTIKSFGGLSSAISQINSFSDAITLLGTNASGSYNIFGKLTSLISTHPYIALATAIGGVLVTAFKEWYISAEEANEAMEQSFGEYEDAKQKVSDVNSELETTKTKMSELESKSGLTFVEQGELEKLREATELLKIQADLAEKEAIREGKEAAESAVTAYEKNFKHDISREAIDEYERISDITRNNVGLFADESDISAMIAGIRQFSELRDSVDKGSEDWEHYNGIVEEATDSVWKQVDSLTGYKEKLESIPTEYLTTEQQNTLQSINDSIELVYKELDPSKWQQIKFDNIFSDEDFANAKTKLVELAKENKNVGITVDDVKNTYPELATAIEDAGFTVQDLVDNINSEANIKIGVEVEKFTSEQKQNVIDSFGNTTGKALTQSAKDAYQEYKEIVNEMSQLGVDPSQTVFGNIDTNNRQVLEWTEENLAKYEDAIKSWGIKRDELANSFSTVLGSSNNYDGVEIAFSPMLQTENGAVLLNSNSVDKYIWGLIDKASQDDGKWSNDEIFKLDAEGLEVDGQKIKGLIADIGETAIQTSEAMHFTGKDGAFANSFKSLEEAAKQAGVSVNELLNSLSNNDEIQSWFDELSPENKDWVYEIGVRSDNTNFWTLDRWQQELDHISHSGKTSQESLKLFYDTLNNTEDGNFSDNINSHIEKIQTLQEALTKINSGELTDSDKLDLAMSFPKLVGKTDEIDTLKDAISDLIDETNQGLDDSFAEQIELLGGKSTEAGRALLALLEMIKSITTTSWNFDIDSEIEKFNKLYDAMKESVTGTGLSSEAIKSIDAMFSGLKGYDSSVLFEKTEHGIHLNTSALRALQSQYEATNKLDIQNRLKDLAQEYRTSEKAVEGLTKGTEAYNEALKAAGVRDTSAILEDIQNVQTLAAQYEGLTSAYNKWILAQSSGEEGDMYDNITGSLENIKQLYEDGLVGTNAFRSAVQMMTDEDLSTVSIDKLLSVYQEGYAAMERYFTEGQEGCIRFLEDIQNLNSEWAHMNEDGSWEIDFGVGNDEEIAKAISQMAGLELSAEQVQIIMRKLSDYGFDINLDSAYASVDELKTRIDETEEKLRELNSEPVDIDIYVSNENLESEIEKAKAKIEEINNSNIEPDVKTAQLEDANAKLDYLIQRLIEAQKPTPITIDASQVDSELANTIVKLQEYQNAVDNLKALELKGADASEIDAAKQKVEELSSELKSVPEEVSTILNLEENEDVDSIIEKISSGEASISVIANTEEAKGQIDSLNNQEVTVNVTVNGQADVDAMKDSIAEINNKSAIVTVISIGKSALEGIKNLIEQVENKIVYLTAFTIGTNLVNALIDAISQVLDKTVEVRAKVYGTSDVLKLAKAINSVNSKTVTVTAKTDGLDALYSLKSLYDSLKDKTVTVTMKTSGSGSGKVDGTAHSQGTAYINGTAFARGDWGAKTSGLALGGELGQELVVRDGRWFTIGDNSAEFFVHRKGDIIFNAEQTKQIFSKGKITYGKKRGSSYAEGTAFSGGSGKFTAGGVTITSSGISNNSDKKNASDSSKNSAEDFKENLDWIEIAIDRVERAISRLDLKANSVYKLWSSRNKNLKSEISEIKNEIDIQEAAYERYIKQADSVGLSKTMAELVRNGAIDIDTIQNEDLAEQVKEYQEWYEKALDCKDAIDELNESISECYQLAFDNIVTQYDGILAVIEHEKNMLEEYISQSEEKGYITSVKYYEALMKTEQSNIDKLEEEKSALLTSLNEALNSGAIEKGSEAWSEMTQQINEVILSIEEANTAMIEYGNSIRDIQWELFDLLQDKLSQVAQESDFLINLLSNDKLYDDRGQLTDEGMSTMGLHGMNYNVYMEQADKYAQEMLNINKQLANDPYNQKLIERKQKLLELQQEMILAAEDEKQAIVDMVREGIELELESLRELIDAYNNALDAKKDLSDYRNNVKEQAKEIASLEKQMLAYEGDYSEEAKAKIQQIKVSLEDAKENLEQTEYDRYISNQKQLLEELYSEYETTLNMRLDNIDVLISDMILEINTNASTISSTLSMKADEVGYTLSDTMKTTWDTASGNITTVITTYGSGIQTSIEASTTTLNTALTTLSSNIQNMVSKLNSKANTNVSYVSTSSASTSSSNSSIQSSGSNTSAKSTSNSSSSKSSTSSKSTSSKETSSSSKNTSSSNDDIFDYKKDSYPKSKLNIDTSVVDRLKYNNFDSSFSARSDYYSELGFSGTYTGSAKQNTQMLNYLKKNGYKNGRYRLSKDELAWTQEGRKMEAIIRPSDGAILTPLAQDDSILNANATSNMFNFANDPSGFIRDNLNIANSISDNPSKNVIGNTFDNDFSFKIELPNVTNYEEFKYAMQHDKGFERMVRAMTVDKMFGGSSLKKYKC